MRTKKRSFCIIGLGRFGQTLAVNLARTDHQVLVIDLDDDVVNVMSDIVTNAVIGDATNESVLRAAGVSDYDCAIVATAKNINDSILTTILLKEMGVKQVVARAGSEQHKRVLEKIGADMVVFPEQDMGVKLVGILDRNNVLEYIEFSDTHSIVEVTVPTHWVDKSLIELDVRRQYGVTVLAVSDPDTGEMNISPDPVRKFTGAETVALLGENKAIDKITK
ncbi:MAG: TrkA family potassium uptake protein [Ruminococcaceae bacterium]|nr:TrkA family potassium uptake protein [Oscillospiraceae bacterium]